MSLCTETVDRGHGRYTSYQPCGREVIEDGLCKIHLRVRDRRRAKMEAWSEQFEFGEKIKTEAEALSQTLGIPVLANYDTIRSRYDGQFVVPGDWLRNLSEGDDE